MHEVGQTGLQVGADTRRIAHHVLRLEHVERGQRGRRGHRMAAVGVAVGDRARAAAVGEKGVGDLVAQRSRAERHVARRDALGQAPDVGLHAPQPGTEQGAAAAEAGHHLVGDEQHVVTVADLAHQRPVGGRRHDHAGRTLDRFGDEGRHRIGALELDLALERGGADLRQLVGVLAVGVVVEPGGVDVETARHQRLIGAPDVAQAVDRHAAEMHAVVALLQADELAALGLALELPVLARDLQRTFDGIAAAVAEHHRGDAVLGHHADQTRREFDRARVAGAAEGVVERQFVELGDDGVAHRAVAVAEVAAPQAGHAVDHLVAVDVPDPAAFAAGDDVGAVLLHRPRVRHRVKQEACVVLLELFDRRHGCPRAVQAGTPTETVLTSV